MKLLIILIPLNVFLVSLVAHGAPKGEQPSTVFVLDTSDSDPAPVSNHHADQSPSDSNTRIISDEGHGTANQKQNDQRKVAAGRRLEEPVHKQASQRNEQKQYKKSAPSSSSSTGAHHEADEHKASVPKTEERLLISITSEEPEEPFRKESSGSTGHSSGVGSGGGGSGHSNYDEPQSLGTSSSSSSSGGQQVHHNQKRKPSITISIQDANLNKQNGNSGTQAVIVRPGEDGQSIVIATVGSQNSNNNNNNKYKPGQTNENGAGSNQRPYNEPINNPIQGIIAQHQVTSTTRRPPTNDYNAQSSNHNRPITSTLVDQQRPPTQLTDERPQRPIQTNLDERPHYEQTSRPSSPIRPASESYSGNNGGGGGSSSGISSGSQDGELSTINDQYQDSSSSSSDEQLGPPGQQQQQGQRKYPLNEKNCGIMHETRIVGGDEADPDDFMWMAAIIKSKPNNGEPRPFCGGSLITRRHILTAAHCLEGLAPRDVLVRLGSYDFEDSASSSSADYAIDQFRVPAQYSKKTHVADLAIMRLKTPLSQGDQYKTVCMPQPRRSYVGAHGLVTGYGSQSQTFRKAAPKLRQVTVPIWENRKCSKVYNKTMGDSFLCAGYEEGGKDACQGDSGGPIMTEGPDQRMMIVGVVSHGIGCGSPGYPGVYTRTTTFSDWIEKNTKE